MIGLIMEMAIIFVGLVLLGYIYINHPYKMLWHILSWWSWVQLIYNESREYWKISIYVCMIFGRMREWNQLDMCTCNFHACWCNTWSYNIYCQNPSDIHSHLKGTDKSKPKKVKVLYKHISQKKSWLLKGYLWLCCRF